MIRYTLSFPTNMSPDMRGQICAWLDKHGYLNNPSFTTERSGPFGLTYTHNISFINVFSWDDSDDAILKSAVSDNPLFSGCTLTQT